MHNSCLHIRLSPTEPTEIGDRKRQIGACRLNVSPTGSHLHLPTPLLRPLKRLSCLHCRRGRRSPCVAPPPSHVRASVVTGPRRHKSGRPYVPSLAHVATELGVVSLRIDRSLSSDHWSRRRPVVNPRTVRPSAAVAGSWGRRGSSTRGPPLKVLVAGSAALSSGSIEAMLKIDHRFRASVEHGIERLRPIFDMGLRWSQD
jgi:hypothetical protein